MKLKRLEIHNYKSLRNVVLDPAPLSVFVGPNAAGKSNFADALDFLGEVYRWDLEGAVKKKGGYENICFRQAARSLAPIRFRVVFDDYFAPPYILDHVFELRAQSRSIGAPFYIFSEEVVLRSLDGTEADAMRITRRRGHEIEFKGPSKALRRTLLGSVLASPRGQDLIKSVSDAELLLLRMQIAPMDSFIRSVGSLRVFQLNPRSCRETGVPTPNADLDRFGGNLPGAIDYLKGHVPDKFDQLVSAVRRIMPSLESIETDFTHTKTLGLFLKEVGVKRPWTAEDVSDGTIQAIALLTATFDPRIPILVIEEPENSVHPWAIRNFVQAFREASETKQIFLTTHSPILIDQIRPEELWVVQRPELATKITPVLELDSSLKDAWGKGKFTLSEYLDSGVIPEAVPSSGV